MKNMIMRKNYYLCGESFHSPEMVELDYWINPLTEIVKNSR